MRLYGKMILNDEKQVIIVFQLGITPAGQREKRKPPHTKRDTGKGTGSVCGCISTSQR